MIILTIVTHFWRNKISLELQFSLDLLLFSHSVMSNYLRTHGQQYTRLPCAHLSQSLFKLMSIE